MPLPSTLQKAQLIEMQPDLKAPRSGSPPVNVQFNPETLKVTYSNNLTTDDNKRAQTGTAAMQHVGKGSTKLSVQLWFDINHPTASDAAPRDVRQLTSQVSYFISPQKDPAAKEETYIVPAVQFHWGAFSFTGVMDGLEETLELFSSDGRPLRASVTFSLTQQKIEAFEQDRFARLPRLPASANAAGRGAVGTAALTAPALGVSLQAVAGNRDWQAIATANAIENPRILAPGQLINLNASASIGFS